MATKKKDEEQAPEPSGSGTLVKYTGSATKASIESNGETYTWNGNGDTQTVPDKVAQVVENDARFKIQGKAEK